MSTHAESKYRRKQMARAVKRGQSVADVAMVYEVSMGLVRLACQEYGVKPPVRPNGNRTGRTLVILAELIRAKRAKTGETMESIGERLGGISRARVHQIAVEAESLDLL